MSKRSVCTNLLQSLNDWTIYVQSRDQTTVIYIDFKKAFDVVSHEKLFIRLQSYNITGLVLQWLKTFSVVAHNKQKLVCHCLMFLNY